MHFTPKMPISTVFGSFDPPVQPKPDIPDTEPDNTDPEVLQSLLEKWAEEEQTMFILAWLHMAKTALDIRALGTAVALFTKPECSTQEELNENRPKLSEESLTETMDAVIKIVGGIVSFKNDTVKDYFAANPPLRAPGFWDNKSMEFAIAKACVTYLALDNFGDLPLPTKIKGMRFDLRDSDPFLTYASYNWYKHIQSVEDAKALEPWLDKVINPAQNNVYLWTDQSSGGCSIGSPRHFYRSRAEIAIKYNIGWLAAYLLESTSSEPEDVFPAKNLPEITGSAPSVLKFLLDRKPGYYRPAINRKVLMEAAALENESLETLQNLFAEESDLCLPSAFLRGVARNSNGDKMFEYLFSKKEDLPITYRMLGAASANDESGGKILKQYFSKDPSIRVNTHMLTSATFARNSRNLRLLLEHDPNAPISGATLESVMRREIQPEKLKVILSVKPDVEIPPSVVELAVELNREGAVKLLFDTHQDLKVTEKIMKMAARSHCHELGMTEYLLERCDPALITEDVLLAGCRRDNSSDKMIALLLQHNTEVKISDEMLLASDRDWSGKLLDSLLERRGGQEVPNKLVDIAVRNRKEQLSWSWRMPKEDEATMLRTLQERVPDDPYLKKVMEATDFTPPAPKNPNRTPRASDLPDAAKTSNMTQLKTLLGQGIDINTTHGSTCGCDRNKGHGTALQRAVKQRDVEMTKLLIEHGANLDLQDGAFGNPLQEAAMAGDMDLVKLLVEAKADVNLEGGRFRSPLIAAAKADDANIVRYLVQNGADINIADSDGWTPYLHAVACESRDAARALLEVDVSLPALGELIALPPSRFVAANDKSTVAISEDGLTINTGALQFMDHRLVISLVLFSSC
jgi:hypothetical protein